MTALALSIAAIVVAFVARDVALRVLADMARERGRERADVKALAALRADVGTVSSTQVTMNERLNGLAEKVERLDGKDQMVAAMGRAKR